MGIGEEMPKVAVLNVADGREWRVELKKYGENDFWLENGWEEFARHYSLSYGHFLVFRYHGNEAFHVLIFDVTATEIQYPSSPPTILEQNHHQHQHQHQHQSSVDHQFMKPIKRTVSPLMSSPRPSKMMRTAISTSKTHLGISGFDQEKKKMISAGRDFSSTETPFFEVVIQYKGSVVIPKEFVRKHMKGDERSVRVRMGEGESKWWVVKLLHYPSAYILSAGWTAFAKYNSLQQGDICKFQLINKPQSLFKISIVSPPSSSFYL
ncbi:B3 domain-containing transcription factor VRN1-like [Carica papaya]|uniref:B3 domain-containing transcription factor VRN1-like n=1 Tax=Carica papaya TaxID=3649 RepID=UPI000B8CF5EB|nr:B3 domain-containing transcription factor VRN1-like [Carica papaya]